MGYEKNQAITQMLHLHEHDKSKITKELVNDIHREFVKQMIHFYQTEPGIEPLPNVEETFAALHQAGVLVGVNTGFSKDIAETVVDRLDWQQKGLIDYLVGSDEVELGRPHPFMIQKMMQAGGIKDPLEVAKVGDTEVDVREGQSAGCKYVIGVTTGIFTREELEQYNQHISLIILPTYWTSSSNNMTLIEQLRAKVAKWPYGLLSVMAAISSFGAYTCMYAFRKAFAAGTFTGQQYFHIDYKVWLVIAQIIGYTLSKFYGIKFISELKPGQRAKYILLLVCMASIAMCCAIILFLFINGFPLDMGLVWLSGRPQITSLWLRFIHQPIFASGL